MFYEQLKRACNMSGTTPTTIVKLLGLSSGNVTNWKNGAKPSLEILERISNELNCSTDFLLGRSTDFLLTGKEEQKKSPPTISEDKQRLLNMYDMLTEREQGEILGELKAITRNRTIQQENVG